MILHKEYVVILKYLLNNSYIRNSVRVEYFFCLLFFPLSSYGEGVIVTLDFWICMVSWLLSEEC